MSKIFESYPLLTNDLKATVYIKNDFEVSYTLEEEQQQLEKKLKEGSSFQYVVKSSNPIVNWNGSENDFIIDGTISFKDINELFENENKITNKNNLIGIGVNVYSKLSKFNRIYNIGELKYDPCNDYKSIEYHIEIEEGTLSEKICIEYFLYLKEINAVEAFYAKEEGIKFGTIDSIELYLEGDGSIFPITQFADPNEPLWKMQVDCDDLDDDVSLNKISLQLNSSHKDFNLLINGIGKDNVMVWKEILSGFFTNLLYKVYIDNESSIDNIITGAYSEGTIGYFVSYLITMFGIEKFDFTEIVELSNKVRKAIYNQFDAI